MQQKIEDSLNASYDNVMQRLRAAFPKWKEEDFHIYAYTATGLSSTTIATLLEKDKPFVYNRLYRLKSRLQTSDLSEAVMSTVPPLIWINVPSIPSAAVIVSSPSSIWITETA